MHYSFMMVYVLLVQCTHVMLSMHAYKKNDRLKNIFCCIDIYIIIILLFLSLKFKLAWVAILLLYCCWVYLISVQKSD